jgi:Baseplate J-like protein
MAAQIPTLSQLYTDILSNLESELNITIPLVGKNFLRALAAVQAAKLKLYYLAIANVQKNIFVDTADPESIGGTLERFGFVKLGRYPFTAQPGSYQVDVTGSVGGIISANTVYKSNDDALNASQLYILDTQYTIVAGLNQIILRALEPGLDSKLSIGDQLTSTEPIANVDSIGTVSAETTTPLAPESIEDYRDKAIEAYQLEPQGGAGADYRLWSKDAQGVKQSYPYAKTGFSNELELYVEATIADSTDGKGTPPAAMLLAVESVVEFDPNPVPPLNERGRRPLGILNIDYNPVTIRVVDIIITGYIGLTPAIDNSITSAIEAALAEIRPFVDSVDILANKNDTMNVFNMTFTVLQAEPASIFTSIDLYLDGILTPSHVFQLGDIPNLNDITYV